MNDKRRSGQTSKLTHVDEEGRAKMVDVTDKAVTKRVAIAEGVITLQPETLRLIVQKAVPKGDVFGVARIAAIAAAKKTGELIPLCHLLPVSHVEIGFDIDEARSAVRIRSRVSVEAKTGVEMEALTAVSVAALTLYDMCKAVDSTMAISDIRLVEKRGGRRGPPQSHFGQH